MWWQGRCEERQTPSVVHRVVIVVTDDALARIGIGNDEATPIPL